MFTIVIQVNLNGGYGKHCIIVRLHVQKLRYKRQIKYVKTRFGLGKQKRSAFIHDCLAPFSGPVFSVGVCEPILHTPFFERPQLSTSKVQENAISVSQAAEKTLKCEHE